jgi:hypothetical protein
MRGGGEQPDGARKRKITAKTACLKFGRRDWRGLIV